MTHESAALHSIRATMPHAACLFTQEIADAICSALAEGKSLRAVCRAEGMPAASTVLSWLKDPQYRDFSEQYARAREIGYQLLADEIIDISDESVGDVVVDGNGNARPDSERVARSKLRVDSRKWLLSKMLPKVYGDKVENIHTGADGGAIEVIKRVVVDPRAA